MSLVRRNGLHASCEPCRKSKHRCDHTEPTCTRCVSRGIAQLCTYHPAPMKGASKRRKLNEPSSTERAQDAAEPSPAAFLASPPDSLVPVSLPTSDPKDVGFLGSTAFNAVFNDNKDHIPPEDAPESEARTGIRLHNQIMAAWKSNSNSPGSTSDLVLELLAKAQHLDKFIDVLPRVGECCSMTIPWLKDIQASVRSLMDTFDLTDQHARRKLVELLDSSTTRPVILPPDVRLRDFLTYYKNRWEVIGVYFTTCGLGLMCTRCDAEILEFTGNTEQAKQQLLFRLLEASDFCVAVCSEASNPSDLGFWLLHDNLIYTSQVLGDSDYNVWRKLGDVSTMVFAQGLHEDSKMAPFWLKEFRRRGLAYAYGGDKVLSTFVGRPPRISKRYCNICIPLDLENAELALEGSELAEVRSNLDGNGWNTKKQKFKRKTSSGPMYVSCALIREEVLELCLGAPQDNVREKANALIARSRDVYESFPQRVRYDPSAALHSQPAGVAVEAYLDHLYNEFMLRRFLVRQIHDDPTELVHLAHQIIEAVITQKNARDEVQSGVGTAWSIVLYGLPAAGVLALELLQLNVRAVSHAKIKQNLCAFISYLKFVHIPGEGNYALAVRAWEILQHIMDKVLQTDKPQPQIQDKGALPEAPEFNQVELMDDFGVLDFSWNDQGHFDQTLWDGLNAMV